MKNSGACVIVTRKQHRILTCPHCGKPFGTSAEITYCSVRCAVSDRPVVRRVKPKVLTPKQAYDEMKEVFKW